MRTPIVLALVTGISLTLLTASSSEAKDKDYLSISGHVVAKVDHAPAGDLLAFEYTVKNSDKKRTAELGVDFSSTVEPTGYICTLISNGRDIDPDTPGCEIGALRPKKKGHVGVIYTMPEVGDLVVKACALDLDNSKTRNSGNCETLTVHEDQ
jgi:hypothetical protein